MILARDERKEEGRIRYVGRNYTKMDKYRVVIVVSRESNKSQ